jgi:hypothetical protein
MCITYEGVSLVVEYVKEFSTVDAFISANTGLWEGELKRIDYLKEIYNLIHAYC